MPTARATGILALGVLALHELRYLVGGGATPGGAHHGHAYLAEAVPVIVVLATALLATTLLAPLGGTALRRGARGAGARAALYGGLLLAVFMAQELAEAILSGIPAAALDALLGPGGLVVVPLALALGGLAAAATRGLEGVEHRLAAAQWATRPSRPRTRTPRRTLIGALLRPLAADALAFGLARRPPPAALQV